jgi:hypothetical protein
VEEFNRHLRGKLALAADKLVDRLINEADSLRPGELAFAANLMLDRKAKIDVTAISASNITQVNNFYDSRGRTKEQIIKELNGDFSTPAPEQPKPAIDVQSSDKTDP